MTSLAVDLDIRHCSGAPAVPAGFVPIRLALDDDAEAPSRLRGQYVFPEMMLPSVHTANLDDSVFDSWMPVTLASGCALLPALRPMKLPSTTRPSDPASRTTADRISGDNTWRPAKDPATPT